MGETRDVWGATPRRSLTMEFHPLALTQVEWRVFIDTCQQVLGTSPTRGLDAVGMSVKEAAAYLGCLDLENKPLEALRNLGPSSRHFHISFLAVLDDDCLIQLHNTELTITAKQLRRESLAIVSGTADVWHRTIVHGCTQSADINLRKMMNLVLAFLERGGFHELFTSLTKVNLPDSTFILRA